MIVCVRVHVCGECVNIIAYCGRNLIEKFNIVNLLRFAYEKIQENPFCIEMHAVKSNMDRIVSIDKNTKICRICLEMENEMRSIYKMGKILDQVVKLCDILSDCTSLVVSCRSSNEIETNLRWGIPFD